MNFTRLVLRGLRHYWRTHVGVLLGSAIATATLVGALLVGDSVRYSLKARALERVGRVDVALMAGDRSFDEELAERLEQAALAGEASESEAATSANGEPRSASPSGSGTPQVAPALVVRALLSARGGEQRVHDVQLFGVDERFFALGTGAERREPPADGLADLNEALARRLGLEAGEGFVLRVEKPSAMPRDLALADDDVSIALRLKFEGVVSSGALADFRLDSRPTAPHNVFVSLAWLQRELELSERANLLLASGEAAGGWDRALDASWRLSDGQLAIAPVEAGEGNDSTGGEAAKGGSTTEASERALELSSSRIFLDEPVLAALASIEGPELLGIFTYFVNDLAAGERSTPYSMVSGLGRLNGGAPSPASAPDASRALGDWRTLVPTGDANGVVINDWLANDLAIGTGDTLRLRYYIVDSSRALVEREHELRVAGVEPMAGLAADASLMPPFPGLSDAENCRDWEPGTPVELDRIRDEDEAYWDEHRGTPKAFVQLETARELWSNRFGALTAVRFPASAEAQVRDALLEGVHPGDLGLFFRPLRATALASADSPTDFSGLFIGLSFFLIVASLLLSTQLFLFGIEQRASELGLYSALGFRPPRVARILLGETLVIAIGGAVLGALLGLGYTRAILSGLASIWSGAVGGAALEFHAGPATLATGAALGVATVVACVAWVARKRLKASSHALLSGSEVLASRAKLATGATTSRARIALALWLVGTLAIGFGMPPSAGPAAAGAYFGAGAFGLACLLYWTRLRLYALPAETAEPLRDLARYARRNLSRRPSRSQATITLMALGTFLVLAIGANRQGPTQNVFERASGTGGFALFGETSLPLVHDLDSEDGRGAFALSDEDLQGVSVVPLRERAGDDASCLSLARASAPTLLGVAPSDLAERDAFRFASKPDGDGSPWLALSRPLDDGTIPAIGDTTSLKWQLHKGVGDTLDYADEFGRPFQVTIVGALADTILQGDILIDEAQFERLFPSTPGYRRLLIDAPEERAAEVSATLSRSLGEIGLALEPTGERLDSFHGVQNTYLAIFQGLGALGLLLGSVGLGMVILRDTLERRSEIALLFALGFPGARIRRVLRTEALSLLGAGLAIGALGALATVAFSLRIPGSELSPPRVLALAAVVAINGLFWVLLAGRIAWNGARGAQLRND